MSWFSRVWASPMPRAPDYRAVEQHQRSAMLSAEARLRDEANSRGPWHRAPAYRKPRYRVRSFIPLCEDLTPWFLTRAFKPGERTAHMVHNQHGGAMHIVRPVAPPQG